MNKLKKIGVIIFILIAIMGSTSFADVVMTPEDAKHHGMSYGGDPVVNNTAKNAAEVADNNLEFVKYIVIGALILVIVFCAIMIIREIVKGKKDKE